MRARPIDPRQLAAHYCACGAVEVATVTGWALAGGRCTRCSSTAEAEAAELAARRAARARRDRRHAERFAVVA